jgi:hypothetical protein
MRGRRVMAMQGLGHVDGMIRREVHRGRGNAVTSSCEGNLGNTYKRAHVGVRGCLPACLPAAVQAVWRAWRKR